MPSTILATDCSYAYTKFDPFDCVAGCYGFTNGLDPQTRMHRSSSTSRASDEFLVNLLPAASSPVKALSSDDLPIYDPVSEATKKEIGKK
ncbi:hypothetical protein Pint_13067 [Pistacia integerrima]|uniref:Uncharacterized protein n=1 Tax=Pistacia integerrima TaxID=434235 RepID=A0ACC0Y723_9ROSI|nr:hypothetical protein Pint_13067 [Pistacia integerrima]